MDKLCIMLLTYNRLDYALQTVEAALSNIEHDGPMHLHIASDGDTQEYLEKLITLACDIAPTIGLSSSNSQRRGYGASFNFATQIIHNLENVKYVMPLEDDWVLTRPLRTQPFCAALDEAKFGCVRLGYLGYTETLRGDVVWAAENHYLRLDPGSSEKHVFAGHPRIETITWEKSVGPWPEHLAAGATELALAGRYEARCGIAWPIGLDGNEGGGLFAHIGGEHADNSGIV